MPTTAQTPIDPGEQENIVFDYAPAFTLGRGVTITGVTSVRCSVVQGSDPNPQSRVLGSPSIVASPSTAAPLQAVMVLIGNMIAGVLYQLQVLVACSDNQVLSIRWYLRCSQPPGT